MPFISKDWRSPGEAWVKTDEGWEKMKVLECTRWRRRSDSEGEGAECGEEGSEPPPPPPPPHCHITVKCTKEIAGFNDLCETVRRLDFNSAVRDVRRFNYICALLSLLVGARELTRLPGAAQRLLLSVLEQVAAQVEESGQNSGALVSLVGAVSAARERERAACWGRPLGSRALWGHHDARIARAQRIADRYRHQPAEESSPRLQDLPEECVREILLRLPDHRDLESSSVAYSVMGGVCAESRVWRRLCRAHFSHEQIQRERARARDPHRHPAWRDLYHALRKAHGLREDVQYAETLSLCRHCECLFWHSLGHPCIADQCPEYRQRLAEAGGPLPPHPVLPAAFLKFFSL